VCRLRAVVSLFALTLSASAGTVPQSQHIWIITEENHSYEKVIGNSNMPYFNSLAKKYAVAAQYYANIHNSLTDLMLVVAGQNVTLWDNTTFFYNVDNVVRHLLLHGMTWKSYQEDLPYAGFTGLSWDGYLRRHNPLIDFTDVCAPSQKLNDVPYSQLAKDIANNATPNYAFISPNKWHDATMERSPRLISGFHSKFPKFSLFRSFSQAVMACFSSSGMKARTPTIVAVPRSRLAAEDVSRIS
jgi:phosphatidylinositol-3-phosphatase